MNMFVEWTRRAVTFVEALKTFGPAPEVTMNVFDPISLEGLKTVQENLQAQIPPPYVEFLTTGSSSLTCRYSIAIHVEHSDEVKIRFSEYLDIMNEFIYGGPAFFSASYLAEGIQSCLGCADGLSDVWPECSARWASSFPFMEMDNGDMLAFDVPNNPKNPPIIYLSHNEEFVRTISPNFQTFLLEWEKINYIGPEIWEFQHWGFIHPETGYLSADAGDLAGLMKKFESA